MELIIDSDALIKLTRCGAKEAVTAAFSVIVPEAVRREVTVETYADGRLLAENVSTGRIHVKRATAVPVESDVLPVGGEREVYALAAEHQDALVMSDDRRFIRRLAMLGRTAQTPATVLVALDADRRAPRERIRAWLEGLRPLISGTEYAAAAAALEGRQ